jgi:TRAP-type C4-dicarboxylate transport system substrate-binding protein
MGLQNYNTEPWWFKNRRKEMSKLLKSLGAAALGVSLLAGSAISSFAADINIRATANSNENDEDYDGLVVFKNYVEAASNGKISVELFIGTQLCSKGAECLQGVADGTIDVYISTSGGAAGAFPYVQVLDLPYLMANDRVAEAVLQSDFTRKVRDMALADSGDKIRLMTVGNTGGWRNFANTKRRVQMPADMEGLKIRTVVADLPQELVKALGAAPTPIPWPELFTSFQTGVVEGSKNGITDIMGMKFPDAGLQYVTLDGHAYMGALWWMSNDSFMAMPEDVRAVVVDGFSQLQQATFASPKRKSIQAYADFVAGGGDLYVPTPAEKAAFKEAATPVYDWFKGNVEGGGEIFDALTSAVADAEADINAGRMADIK